MKTTLTYENLDSASDYAKNEDPAKMTYSIPDFVCEPQHDQETRFLPSIREKLTKIQDQDLERCESSILLFLTLLYRRLRLGHVCATQLKYLTLSSTRARGKA